MKKSVHPRLSAFLALVGLQGFFVIERAPSRGVGALSPSDELAASNALALFNGEEPFGDCSRHEARKGSDIVFLLAQCAVTGTVVETAGPTVAIASFKDRLSGNDKLAVLQQDAFDLWHSIGLHEVSHRDDATAQARGLPKKSRFGAIPEMDEFLSAMAPGDAQALLRSIAATITGDGAAQDKRSPKDVLTSVARQLQRIGLVPDKPLVFAEDKKKGKEAPPAPPPAPPPAESSPATTPGVQAPADA
ncbi:hypothetical protein EKK58_05515 [Candidatus Dependentiae bacterium]|nr:MAG: hypothetical protein EKK58_05515 [Candidatus Dependentiae bacterium]